MEQHFVFLTCVSHRKWVYLGNTQLVLALSSYQRVCAFKWGCLQLYFHLLWYVTYLGLSLYCCCHTVGCIFISFFIFYVFWLSYIIFYLLCWLVCYNSLLDFTGFGGSSLESTSLIYFSLPEVILIPPFLLL